MTFLAIRRLKLWSVEGCIHLPTVIATSVCDGPMALLRHPVVGFLGLGHKCSDRAKDVSVIFAENKRYNLDDRFKSYVIIVCGPISVE